MGVVVRQSIKSSVVNYVGIGIGAVNLMVLSAKFLPPEMIGLMAGLLSASTLFTAFTQLGTPFISDKFFPQFRDDNAQHHGFLPFILLYPLLGYAIFLVCMFVFKEDILTFYSKKSDLLTDYYWLIAVLTFALMYQNVLESYCRLHFRIAVPTLIREVFLKLMNSFFILLFAFKFISLHTFIYVSCSTYFIQVIFLVFYIKSLKKWHLKPDWTRFDWRLLKQMSGFGLYIILGGMGTLLVSKLDMLMLPALAGWNFTGIYSMANYMGTVVEIPKKTMSQINIPILSAAWQRNDQAKILDIYQQTSLHQLLAGLVVFLLIWCNIDAIFSLIPNAKVYETGKYVVFFVGISKLTDMATGMNGEIILYSPRYKFTMFAMVFLALLTFYSTYTLIPMYGVTGAAIATALSIFCYTLLKFIFVLIAFKMQPFTKKSIYVLLIAIFTYVLVCFVPDISYDFSIIQINYFINIIAKSSIIVLVFMGLTIYFNVSKELNSLFNQIFRPK